MYGERKGWECEFLNAPAFLHLQAPLNPRTQERSFQHPSSQKENEAPFHLRECGPDHSSSSLLVRVVHSRSARLHGAQTRRRRRNPATPPRNPALLVRQKLRISQTETSCPANNIQAHLYAHSREIHPMCEVIINEHHFLLVLSK